MEQFFASLSKRQTMLLLTAVTFGGQDAGAALEHLPEAEAELLRHRASELMQIPREKRIPLLVQEIKRLINARRKQLVGADPERLAEFLAQERAPLVEVVLRALPGQLAEPVRAQLPQREVNLRREVKPEVLNIIRWKLEQRLQKGASLRGAFKFSDVLVLQARELLTICDRMGARALATSLAALPDADRETFLSSLPPDQKMLAARAADAGKERSLMEKDARAIIELHGGLAQPSLVLRSAGAQRLARACLAQGQEFATRFAERHPSGELGKALARWLRKEGQRPTQKGDGGRKDIVEQMERLAEKGIIDRPMRLPPPPPPRSGLPGGKVLAPSPRGASAPASSPLRRPDPRGTERDPIAERDARRAGIPSREQAPETRRPRSSEDSGRPTARPQGRANVSPTLEKPPVRRGPSGRGSRGGSS